MIYIFGILFSLFIVAGNTLYKYAVDAAGFEISSDFLLSKKFLSFIFSWQLLGGLSLFIIGSGISFWMLTKFEFSAIQAVSVPVVMGLSFLVGQFLLHEENLSLLNYLGLLIIVVGVVLAAHR
jgi:drug/metabolite transporter (DMT)-like permease